MVAVDGQVADALTALLAGSRVSIEALYDWPLVAARLRERACDCLVVGAANATRAVASLLPDSHMALAVYSPGELDGDLARDLRRQTEIRAVRVSQSVERLFDARDAWEREYILAAMAAFEGNISRTADALGLERSNLYKKMRALGITAGRRDEEPAHDEASGAADSRRGLER